MNRSYQHRFWMCFVGVMLCATPAFAFPIFVPSVHKVLVFAHVFGAIIFMGNIIVSASWMSRAKRTRNLAVIHFAVGMVNRNDWTYTIPGILLILVPGLLTVGPWGGFPGASWAELALALFLLSGVIWGAALLPLQKRMKQLTTEAVELKVGLSDYFYKVLSRWMMWGGIATLLPFVALGLMVYKPTLWGGGQ